MFRFLSYFRYFLYRVNEHSLHSPLVYDLFRKVIKKGKKIPLDPEIEKLRSTLENSKEIIEVTDFGTGKSRSPNRSISSIAKKALTPARKSALLQKLGIYFESKEFLELGTSLGLNTLYLSRIPEAIITTFEGCENIAEIAVNNIKSLNQNNVRVVTGNIDNSLPDFLAHSSKLDFVFFDANHAYRPTIDYYNMCFNKAHDESVFVFDDIHYSEDMERAWDEISNSVEVTLSIDLYHLGIVLFDPSLSKRNYVLSY